MADFREHAPAAPGLAGRIAAVERELHRRSGTLPELVEADEQSGRIATLLSSGQLTSQAILLRAAVSAGLSRPGAGRRQLYPGTRPVSGLIAAAGLGPAGRAFSQSPDTSAARVASAQAACGSGCGGRSARSAADRRTTSEQPARGAEVQGVLAEEPGHLARRVPPPVAGAGPGPGPAGPRRAGRVGSDLHPAARQGQVEQFRAQRGQHARGAAGR